MSCVDVLYFKDVAGMERFNGFRVRFMIKYYILK